MESFFGAANGTLIPYFDEVKMTVSFGYDKTFTWMFVMANITGAILGCDFLQHFNIALEFGKRELIFLGDSRPNIVSLDVKDADLRDRETGLSNSESMSVNSFVSHMKPVHHHSCDSLHERNKMANFSHQWKAISQLIGRSKRIIRRITISLSIIIKKARNHVTYTSGNHQVTKQNEALIAAKTDSNTIENRTLCSSLNLRVKPFEPNDALNVADVVRVNKSIEKLCEHFECLFNLDNFRALSDN